MKLQVDYDADYYKNQDITKFLAFSGRELMCSFKFDRFLRAVA